MELVPVGDVVSAEEARKIPEEFVHSAEVLRVSVSVRMTSTH